MIETEDYKNRKVMSRGKAVRTGNGWRALHTDFINNLYHVTFVIGSDDPHNSDESKDRQSKFELEKLLIVTLQNDTMTFSDLKMLLRIEHDLELKQSTIDKLIIVRQGGLSGIAQRIKNLFGI